MADQIKYKNLSQKNEEENGVFSAKLFGVDNQGGIDKVREDMKDKYGWLSPYEYYYGSPDREDSEIERTSLMPIFTPAALGLVEENSDLYADVEAANKDDIPNWFWVDSLSNWCYIKPTCYLPTKELYNKRTFMGEILHGLAGFQAITGNWVGAIITELIIQSAEGGLDEWYKTVPTGIVTDWVDLSDNLISAPIEYGTKFVNKVSETIFTTVDRITGGIPGVVSQVLSSLMESTKVLANKANLMTMSGMISALIRMFFNANTADSDSEALIEMDITGEDTYNLSRNCLSIYMWNGYTRSWMPIKWMIQIYDRYMKKGNRNLFKQLFGNTAEKIAQFHNEYLYTIVPKEFVENQALLDLDTTGNIRSLINDFNSAINDWNSNHVDTTLYSRLENIIERSWNTTNALTRSVFMQVFTFDPSCFESFTTRSPLNKLQTIATAAWNKEGMNGDPKARWLENWSMWIPLPNEKAKIKIYANNTFQLINRPYYDFRYDQEVTRGNIHTNIGHPCFMRGNDDVLWMGYWVRWSSPPRIDTNTNSTFFGLIETSKSTTSYGVSDISDKDIENWNAIVDSMFQKHDEYGFEDWMINGNYGISYSKFTIDEESPTSVSSYEESELNPQRVPMVNSIDKIMKSKMVLSLSDRTVVNREDRNGIGHVAKRWR